MKITYLDCGKHGKLFSWYLHDFKTIEADGEYFMIDGGISAGLEYGRYSGGKVEDAEIKDIITDVRNSFMWGKNYNKDNVKLPQTEYALLKDLDSSHICGILSYFTKKLYMSEAKTVNKNWCIIHEFFIQELDYRINNQII